MDKFRIKIDGLMCLRCSYKWKPQEGNQLPTICPKCKSPYWSKERKKVKNG